MKRTLGIFSSVALGLALVFGNAGCGDTAKKETDTKVTTPTGSTEKKTTEETTKKGDAKDDKGLPPKDAPK